MQIIDPEKMINEHLELQKYRVALFFPYHFIRDFYGCFFNLCFQGSYNTPLEHTPTNPPRELWKEFHYSRYSLLVKVARAVFQFGVLVHNLRNNCYKMDPYQLLVFCYISTYKGIQYSCWLPPKKTPFELHRQGGKDQVTSNSEAGRRHPLKTKRSG